MWIGFRSGVDESRIVLEVVGGGTGEATVGWVFRGGLKGDLKGWASVFEAVARRRRLGGGVGAINV